MSEPGERRRRRELHRNPETGDVQGVAPDPGSAAAPATPARPEVPVSRRAMRGPGGGEETPPRGTAADASRSRRSIRDTSLDPTSTRPATAGSGTPAWSTQAPAAAPSSRPAAPPVAPRPEPSGSSPAISRPPAAQRPAGAAGARAADGVGCQAAGCAVGAGACTGCCCHGGGCGAGTCGAGGCVPHDPTVPAAAPAPVQLGLSRRTGGAGVPARGEVVARSWAGDQPAPELGAAGPAGSALR